MTPPEHQLYPIAFTVSAGNINTPPWEDELREAFSHTPSLHGLLSARVTLEQAQRICESNDITPHLGFTARHRCGDTTFNIELAQEQLSSIARAYSVFKNAVWTPSPPALTGLAGYAELLNVLEEVIDQDWNIQHHLVDAELDQRFDFTKFLTPACCDQSSTR